MGSYPLVHKMVPIYIVSYVLLWVHLMYTDYCGVLLLHIDDAEDKSVDPIEDDDYTHIN